MREAKSATLTVLELQTGWIQYASFSDLQIFRLVRQFLLSDKKT